MHGGLSQSQDALCKLAPVTSNHTRNRLLPVVSSHRPLPSGFLRASYRINNGKQTGGLENDLLLGRSGVFHSFLS